MKLRNKKTRKIGELYYHPEKEYCFTVATEDPADTMIYKTIGGIWYDWEDYIPSEPLIKDEKIRKVVRAWADANDIRFGRRCGSLNAYSRRIVGWNAVGTSFTIEFDKDLKMYGDKITKDVYTIDELCGEEE